ncbi:hypothetical protein [Frigoribacterium sp. RIT-PI-h]|uniref:hypothetical protein n=1 Tax=Frigoribacterium sp. RIT-PI-h TaxID=1690245 RepID=UPI0006B98947|nr:hypothetical protein [Frigoribacterium sp. RIT-PI-h]KPG84727.1 hypothetical protein AEQ27_06500 [Frigoribacterium sp. RIT-PI-h]
MDSSYTRDATASPLAIHPYPKHQSRSAGGRDHPSPAREARAASDDARPVRYEDFFEDDEGASRSA